MRTAADWTKILAACGAKPPIAAAWGQVFADTVKPTTFSAGDADIQDFLGQILHESAGLTVLAENLNYLTAARLCAVWPIRFPSELVAAPYVRNPEALANLVYGGRMGNLDRGDGWTYRGRTPLQITGRANYVMVGNLVGQDLDVMPELLEQPHFALEACIAWWENVIPDSILGDPQKVTQRVNGGLIGLADREQLTAAASRALAA